jgi:hypothetical protein
MSTIKVDNIRIASESVSRSVRGVAAAWCHWQTAPSTYIKDSSNIASLTDASVGYTLVYYTDEMASDGYAISAVSNSVNIRETNTSHSAERCQIVTSDSANDSQDATRVSAIVNGDLA